MDVAEICSPHDVYFVIDLIGTEANLLEPIRGEQSERVDAALICCWKVVPEFRIQEGDAGYDITSGAVVCPHVSGGSGNFSAGESHS